MSTIMFPCAACVAAVCLAPSARADDDPGSAPEFPSASFSLQPDSKDAPPLPVENDTSFLKAWKGSVEFGLNGSAGNSESLNLRGGINLGRKTDAMETLVWANYAFATSAGDKSTSRGELGADQDWFINNSQWLLFVDGLVEYDEFQPWNWRLSGHLGFGYSFIKDDTTTLIGRLGAGFNQTLGGEEEQFTPEGLLGVDFTRKFSDRQKIYVSVDYFPSFDNFPDYRLNARAGWEIMVDTESKMTLRIGVEDRYDSNPGGTAENNDIDYFVLLGWGF